MFCFRKNTPKTISLLHTARHYLSFSFEICSSSASYLLHYTSTSTLLVKYNYPLHTLLLYSTSIAFAIYTCVLKHVFAFRLFESDIELTRSLCTHHYIPLYCCHLNAASYSTLRPTNRSFLRAFLCHLSSIFR